MEIQQRNNNSEGIGFTKRGAFLQLRQAFKFAKLAHLDVSMYVILGIVSGLTETLGIALLVPLIDALASEQRLFDRVPLLGGVANMLDAVPEEFRIVTAVSLIAVVVIIRGCLALFVDVQNYSIPLKIEQKLRLIAIRALQSAEQKITETIPIEKISTNCVEFPARIGIAIRFAAIGAVVSVIAIVMIALIVVISPVISLIALSGAIVIATIYRIVTKNRISNVSQHLTGRREEFNRLFFETFYGLGDDKIFGGKRRTYNKNQNATEELMKVQRKNLVLELMSYPFVSTFAGLSVCAGIFYLSTVPAEDLPRLVAPLGVLVALVMRLISPLTTLNICRHHFGLHAEVFTPFEQFLKSMHSAKEHSGPHEVRDLKGGFEFRKVGFKYDNGGEFALQDIDVNVKPGELIAIVGPSGGGKSTLAKIFASAYLPNTGSVYLDGTEIREYNRESVRKHIALVSQTSHIARETIAQSIAMDDSPELKRVQDAALLGSASEFIEKLDDKYDTVLVNHANMLSSGQKQRLLLSRAFHHRPKILILDEALNYQDSVSRREILRKIHLLHNKATIIIVTHEYEIAKGADRVLVIDGGKLIQCGTPEELITEEGYFKTMAGF